MMRENNSLSLILKKKKENKKEMRAHYPIAMNGRDDKNKMEKVKLRKKIKNQKRLQTNGLGSVF